MGSEATAQLRSVESAPKSRAKTKRKEPEPFTSGFPRTKAEARALHLQREVDYQQSEREKDKERHSRLQWAARDLLDFLDIYVSPADLSGGRDSYLRKKARLKGML